MNKTEIRRCVEIRGDEILFQGVNCGIITGQGCARLEDLGSISGASDLKEAIVNLINRKWR